MEKDIKEKPFKIKVWFSKAYTPFIAGGVLVFILNIVTSGVSSFIRYSERIDNLTTKVDAVEARLGNIEKDINDLTNKITEWQHQAKRNNDLFERFENKIWKSAIKK